MNWRSYVGGAAQEAARIYFAPIQGAFRAILEEAERPSPPSAFTHGFSFTALRDEFRAAAGEAPRRYFAPLVGAIDAVVAEIKRP